VKSPATRITIDIDSHVQNPRLRLLRAVHGLEQVGAYHTEVATSSSGKGFHVVGHFDDRIPLDEQFRIRENLNDDPNRIKMDRQRAEKGLPINTMWHSKGGNEGERTVYDTVDDAIDAADAATRTYKERLNGIQNHGHKAVTDAHIDRMPTNMG
jgi:hypothetical protein